ncbi:hypothetical protein [Streptomyces glaucescens]|uniref:hypothetical protein n=1 Tax=Streptomyces glaucescens TaxID=1907 RepID=UPI00131BD8CF|nr:hypothetical protein [Streptomyces glaucescens]
MPVSTCWAFGGNRSRIGCYGTVASRTLMFAKFATRAELRASRERHGGRPMRRRLWAARGRETYVPLRPGKRARARRSSLDWVAAVVEGIFDGIAEFLCTWGRR